MRVLQQFLQQRNVKYQVNLNVTSLNLHLRHWWLTGCMSLMWGESRDISKNVICQFFKNASIGFAFLFIYWLFIGRLWLSMSSNCSKHRLSCVPNITWFFSSVNLFISRRVKRVYTILIACVCPSLQKQGDPAVRSPKTCMCDRSHQEPDQTRKRKVSPADP